MILCDLYFDVHGEQPDNPLPLCTNHMLLLSSTGTAAGMQLLSLVLQGHRYLLHLLDYGELSFYILVYSRYMILWYSHIFSLIFCIQVADIFIYTALAWYFSQVWPSKVGVARPFYFIFLRSYWFPHSVGSSEKQVHPASTGEDSGGNPLEAGTATISIPAEVVNETLVGEATVTVNQLNKTYGSTTVVNDLSFKMYENQIFALLGHNGAGKVTTK